MFINKHIKSFEQYILAEENVKHIEDIETDDGSDEDHEEELEDLEKEDADTCPRCGDRNAECKCDVEDHWSTQTYHRVPKGENGSMEPKQKFGTKN